MMIFGLWLVATVCIIAGIIIGCIGATGEMDEVGSSWLTVGLFCMGLLFMAGAGTYKEVPTIRTPFESCVVNLSSNDEFNKCEIFLDRVDNGNRPPAN